MAPSASPSPPSFASVDEILQAPTSMIWLHRRDAVTFAEYSDWITGRYVNIFCYCSQDDDSVALRFAEVISLKLFPQVACMQSLVNNLAPCLWRALSMSSK